jgi:uncharacterized membrane protein YphA (DoxX/SURF4 family)
MTTDSEPNSTPEDFVELPPEVDVVLTRPAKSRRRALTEKIVLWCLRLYLAGLFVYAGAEKIVNPIRFTEDIRNYQLVHDPIPAAVAITLPWLEIFAALGVLTGLLYRGSLVVLIGMLASFIVVISSAWARGLDISCGCFGGASAKSTNYPIHLAETAIWMGMAVILLLYTWRRDRRLMAHRASA